MRMELVFLCLWAIYWVDLRTALAEDTFLSCPSSIDQQFKGRLLDCTDMKNQSITSLKLPANVTTLILDDIKIHTIQNYTFHLCTNLKSLSLQRNDLQHIELFAFEGLNHLEVLTLEINYVVTAGSAWSDGLFKNLSNLRVLNLYGNHQRGVFSENLFLGLDNLESLYLESFRGDLKFNKTVSHLPRLHYLSVTGDMTQINNDTFSMFQTAPLETLDLIGSFKNIELNAFEPLKYLRSFTLDSRKFGVTNALESLYAFQHRNMTNLFLKSIHLYHKLPNELLLTDGVLNIYKTRYLSQICIENFALTNSGVYVIKGGALTGSLWQSCLKSLDLSGNPIVGDNMFFLELTLMASLQTLVISNRKKLSLFSAKDAENTFRKDHQEWHVCLSDSNGYASEKKPGVYSLSQQNSSLEDDQFKTLGNETVKYHNANVSTKVGLEEKYGNTSDSTIQNAPGHRVNNAQTSSETVSRHIGTNDGSAFKSIPRGNTDSDNMPDTWNKSKLMAKKYITVWVPEKLEVLHAESMSNNLLAFNGNVLIRGAYNLRELYLSDNGLHDFIGVYRGFNNLKLFDISFNDCSVISPTFFDVFFSLKQLGMRRTMLDGQTMRKHSARLFQQLTQLHHLDLSDNSLNMLEAGTFQSNTDLRTLSLYNNRFNSIPIDLKNVPKLCYLDMRWNSIIHFTDEEMNSLDAHAMSVPCFSLLLEGNILSCDCSHLKFLQWLQQTHVQLDKQRNFSCFNESGDLSTTYFRGDIQALWRKCVGKTYFLSSVALFILMVLAFVLFILITRYKTHLLSILLQMFSPQFALRKPCEYPIGVFISYSDQDTSFACHFLRRFVENELGMSTFLRDRDLLPASDIAESIVETVNRSWRVLLVISEEYLYEDDWAYFTMKTAAYTVNRGNPSLLVVLVEERLRHKLPRCLLRAVDENNIISLTRQDKMNYDERQKLKTSLVH